MEIKTNFGKKSIFDASIKKLLITAITEGQVKQLGDDNIEIFSVLQNGKEIAKIRENYKLGRSTIEFNGQIFTKRDRHFVTGEINNSLTDSTSAESTNTIDEKDFAEIYSLAAVHSR